MNLNQVLRMIEKEYNMEDGELDRFNVEQEESSTTRVQIYSDIEHFGLAHVLNKIADAVKDPAESDLVKIFISETTERLSEDDIKELTNIVEENLADFTIEYIDKEGE